MFLYPIIKISLIFSRIYFFIIFFPIIDNKYIPWKIKVIFSFFISCILFSFISEKTIENRNFYQLLFTEMFLGISIGILVKLHFEIIKIASNIIAIQSSVLYGTNNNVNYTESNTLINNFLFTLAIACIFATNTHHIFIKSIYYSYHKFPIGYFFQIENYSKLLCQNLVNSFQIALRISFPCIIINFILLLATSILSKIISSIQVVFMLTQIQMITTLCALSLCLFSLMNKFNDVLINFSLL